MKNLTHEQSKKRRKKIAGAIAAGERVEQVASNFGVSTARAYIAYCEFFPGTPIDQRGERRKKIAQAVRGGKDVRQVASDFGVVLPTVFSACKQFSVIINGPVLFSPPVGARKSRRVTVTQWNEADWTQPDSDLARLFGVSRERVRQIRHGLGKPRSLFRQPSRPALRPGGKTGNHQETV